MSKTTPEQNKALVLEAFDTLFNKRIQEWTADVRRSLPCLMRINHATPISGVTSIFDFQSEY
jgi:hypothetical protein